MGSRETVDHAVVTLSQRGWGQRRIAAELGVGRKLVRGILVRVEGAREHGHTVLPAVAKKRGSALDAYLTSMQGWLDRFPDITAVRMHDELCSEGYGGGKTAVKDRLRLLRPRPKKAWVQRFETPPGAQGQQDWSPYDIPFTQTGTARVKAFSLILGYSRRQYLGFDARENLIAMMRQHARAGERFKGLPKEILYDNQKVVVLRREVGKPIYNPKFLAFAAHYGFTPRVLPPRAPELKGKVERPFQYVEGNCLNARTFRNKAELDAHAERWMTDTSDVHLHDTTRQRPIDRYEDERDALLPLPRHPYDTAEVGYRVVSDDALVRWEDVPYSVPTEAVLDVVVVRATEKEIFVYKSDLSVLAVHERAPRGHHEAVVNPAHRPTRRPTHDIEALAARVGELGDAGVLFATGIVKTQRYRAAALLQVLGLVETYSADDVRRAITRATHSRAFDAGVVTRILAASATPRVLPSTTDRRAHHRLAEQGAALATAPRSLSEYALAIAGTRDDEDGEDHDGDESDGDESDGDESDGDESDEGAVES